jgi:hypothetical protein
VQADPSPSLQSISAAVRKQLGVGQGDGRRRRRSQGRKVAGSSLPARKLKKSIPLHSTPRSVTPVIVVSPVASSCR